MRFSAFPSFDAEVSSGLEGFQKPSIQEEQSWYDVISFHARMVVKNINDQGIIEVEKSGGWGSDIRGKAKGVPLLRITKTWLQQMDHRMKSTQRSFSAPPRVKRSEKKDLNPRSRLSSEGDSTVENVVPSPIDGVHASEDVETLWEEFAEVENQVIENRLFHYKLW
ncbi:unnamed protein product [Auanema sp. JU1783]|nr:unnamed protein product [Auanema sp. JU1783]